MGAYEQINIGTIGRYTHMLLWNFSLVSVHAFTLFLFRNFPKKKSV